MDTSNRLTISFYYSNICEWNSRHYQYKKFTPAIYTNQLLIGAKSVNVNWDSFEGIIDDVKIYNCSGIEIGIDVLNSNSSIKLYPNPTTGLVHLSGYFTGKISVFNSLGKKVFKKTDSDFIDFTNQTPGLYFIRFEKVDQNHSIKVLKF